MTLKVWSLKKETNKKLLLLFIEIGSLGGAALRGKIRSKVWT